LGGGVPGAAALRGASAEATCSLTFFSLTQPARAGAAAVATIILAMVLFI